MANFRKIWSHWSSAWRTSLEGGGSATKSRRLFCCEVCFYYDSTNLTFCSMAEVGLEYMSADNNDRPYGFSECLIELGRLSVLWLWHSWWSSPLRHQRYSVPIQSSAVIIERLFTGNCVENTKIKKKEGQNGQSFCSKNVWKIETKVAICSNLSSWDCVSCAKVSMDIFCSEKIGIRPKEANLSVRVQKYFYSSSSSSQPVWPDKNCQMSITVAQKWFH